MASRVDANKICILRTTWKKWMKYTLCLYGKIQLPSWVSTVHFTIDLHQKLKETLQKHPTTQTSLPPYVNPDSLASARPVYLIARRGIAVCHTLALESCKADLTSVSNPCVQLRKYAETGKAATNQMWQGDGEAWLPLSRRLQLQALELHPAIYWIL